MLQIEYEGTVTEIDETQEFIIGREGDLAMPNNPYLHRHFLKLTYEHEFWWLMNVGHSLSATIFDPRTRLQAWLRPGTRIPLVFGRVEVVFIAGPLSYTLSLVNDEPVWENNQKWAPPPPYRRNNYGSLHLDVRTTAGHSGFGRTYAIA